MYSPRSVRSIVSIGSLAIAFVHLGYTGPMRLNIDAEGNPIRPFGVRENPYSILDVTDIVFVDPVNVGLSRMVEGQDRSHGVVLVSPTSLGSRGAHGRGPDAAALCGDGLVLRKAAVRAAVARPGRHASRSRALHPPRVRPGTARGRQWRKELLCDQRLTVGSLSASGPGWFGTGQR